MLPKHWVLFLRAPFEDVKKELNDFISTIHLTRYPWLLTIQNEGWGETNLHPCIPENDYRGRDHRSETAINHEAGRLEGVCRGAADDFSPAWKRAADQLRPVQYG